MDLAPQNSLSYLLSEEGFILGAGKKQELFGEPYKGFEKDIKSGFDMATLAVSNLLLHNKASINGESKKQL